MAVTNPNQNGSLNWRRLGVIIPNESWQSYSQFTGTPTTFKLTAFSINQEYYRYCYVRVKYHLLSNPIYSRWERIYPSPIPTEWTPQINSEFATLPKSIEVIDYFMVKAKEAYSKGRIFRYGFPKKISWTLTIEFLED